MAGIILVSQLTRPRPFVFGRLWKDAATLAAGSLSSAALGLAVVGITARHLGPSQFGKLALITAGYLLASRLFVVQTGPAIISFGARTREQLNPAFLACLLAWCLRLELGTATLAAIVLAITLGMVNVLLPNAYGTLLLAAAVTLVPLAINVSSYAGGVLRLSGTFQPVAMQGVIANAVKLTGCLVVYCLVLEPTVLSYAVVWSFGDCCGLLFLAASSRAAYVKLVGCSDGVVRKPTEIFPGLSAFVATGVGHNAIKSLVREGDVIAVGILAGSAAAGSYRLIKQIGSAVGRFVDPLQQAMYPLLAQQAAKGDLQGIRLSLIRVALITSIAFVAVLACFMLVGGQLLHLVLGAGYDTVFPGAMIYLFGTAIAMISVGLHPAALSLGLPLESLLVLGISSVVYAVVLLLLVPIFGVNGAALAYVAFYMVWAFQLTLRIRSRLVPLHG